MSIEVKNLAKRFGQTVVCDNLNLNIPSGELVALLGPSGSGKTSLLRIIAGLETPDSGTVLFNGEDTTHVAVRERNVGFVFQHYALFGHMTIFENVAFGLRVRPKATRPPEAEIKKKVTELLKLVQLDWIADRYPHQLSGGMRQRAAIAADGPDKLHFAWWGPTDDPKARYMFRVEGPSIIIDYVREGSPGGGFNHVHSIARDPRNDYGALWLEQHYKEAHQD